MELCAKLECTGCSACYSVCSQNAISMIQDEEGFLIPKIDDEKCTNCGICKKVCNERLNQKNKSDNFPYVYAVKANDVILQRKSSSGGIFSIIANYVLEKNGVVYGAAFDEKLICKHIRIDNKTDLARLRGSKYVQSEINDCFSLVKKDLLQNASVLFSGTPCQVAGLKSFLQKDYTNLFCIDILCHGVPSPKLFAEYKIWLEKKYNAKLIDYEFRNKDKKDWSLTYRAKIVTSKQTNYATNHYDPYYFSFLKGQILRESCYSCDYFGKSRVGDISIGDYWGIQKEHKDFTDYNGVSAVLVNNEKGQNVFNEVKCNIKFMISALDNVSKHNHNLIAPTVRPAIRDDIFKKDIDFLFRNANKKTLTQKIRILVPVSIKKIVKKFRV